MGDEYQSSCGEEYKAKQEVDSWDDSNSEETSDKEYGSEVGGSQHDD